jgi:quercetin dioxygenase-like cupin family protein
MKYVLCVVVVALTAAGAAFASTNHPSITERVLADGQVAKPYTIEVTKPGDIVVASAKLSPHASFGWHSHRAAVAVAVVEGTLTLYDTDTPGCAAQRVRTGQGFVEQPNHVHLARNETRHDVKVLVTYLGAPHGESPDVPAERPAGCTVG